MARHRETPSRCLLQAFERNRLGPAATDRRLPGGRADRPTRGLSASPSPSYRAGFSLRVCTVYRFDAAEDGAFAQARNLRVARGPPRQTRAVLSAARTRSGLNGT